MLTSKLTSKLSSAGVPASPQDFATQPNSSRSITLSWTTAGGGGGLPLRNYTLRYRRSDTDQYSIADVFIGAELERYSLSGLHPNTKYYFTLAAVNDKGRTY